MSTVLKVENLSKLYRLGELGTGTLSHDINRWWHRVRGKEDPYTLIGQINDRSKKSESDYVWALKDINFEVKQGEILGIIGKNGAGKSTLLKLLSKITTPTSGVIKSKGRIAALLEVGTAMHAEMTARENIYMNGAILGMTKREITNKFDEIVDFSGCAMYVDTPLKRFSSGMKVRLGFAVAAFLEPEILIVDEVLAVGDAEFQKKAIGKMQDISKGGGRTVLFVSHNMASVKSLCSKALILENGTLVKSGDVDELVSYYLSGNAFGTANYKTFNKGDLGIENFWLKNCSVKASGYTFNDVITRSDEIEVEISYLCDAKQAERLDFNLRFKGEDGVNIFNTSTGHIIENLIDKGDNKVVLKIPSHFFTQGVYFLDIMLVQNNRKSLFVEPDVMSFTVNPERGNLGSWMGKGKSYLKPRFKWEKL